MSDHCGLVLPLLAIYRPPSSSQLAPAEDNFLSFKNRLEPIIRRQEREIVGEIALTRYTTRMVAADMQQQQVKYPSDRLLF